SLDLSGDAAMVKKARRYFLSRGPATVNDFAWWGGMTLGQAKRGLEVVKGELTAAVFDGVEYWFGTDVNAARPGSGVAASLPAALLLPAYDELTVGYTDRSAIFLRLLRRPVFRG